MPALAQGADDAGTGNDIVVTARRVEEKLQAVARPEAPRVGVLHVGFRDASAFGEFQFAVVDIDGDGSILMNIQELATISTYEFPIKIVVINNGHLGMIRQMQDLFYDARFTTSDLGDRVDLVAVARGFGIPAERVAVDKDPAEAIARMSGAEGPYMVEAMVDPDNYVYPIIPPGASNVEMICGK